MKACVFSGLQHRERNANPFLDQALGYLLCIAAKTTALSNSSNTGFQTNVALKTVWVSAHEVIQLLSFIVCSQLVPIRGDNLNNYKAIAIAIRALLKIHIASSNNLNWSHNEGPQPANH